MWAEEDARKWAEHKASLREEASRWRGATEVRSERLQDVETAQTVPNDSADTCESSGSIPVIGLARRPARRPTRRSAGRPAERPAGRAAGRPAGRPERRPARRLAGRPAKRPRDDRRDGQWGDRWDDGRDGRRDDGRDGLWDDRRGDRRRGCATDRERDTAHERAPTYSAQRLRVTATQCGYRRYVTHDVILCDMRNFR